MAKKNWKQITDEYEGFADKVLDILFKNSLAARVLEEHSGNVILAHLMRLAFVTSLAEGETPEQAAKRMINTFASAELLYTDISELKH